MTTRYPCPKCGGHSWFEKDGSDLLQRCLCGLHRYLFREQQDGVTVMRSGVRVPDVSLPRTDTKIYRCLVAVRNAYPQTIKTGSIAEVTGLNGKETASLVVTLMGRGLLERVAARRGLLGGSIWQLTVTAQKLLGTGGDKYGTGTGTIPETQLLSERLESIFGEDRDTYEGEGEDSWIDRSDKDDW